MIMLPYTTFDYNSVESLVARNRQTFSYYKERLNNHDRVHVNPEEKGTVNGYWMPTIGFNKMYGIVCEILMEAFAKGNIDARGFFWPLSAWDMFMDRKENIISWSAHERAINLPSYHNIDNEKQGRVISVILIIMNAKR